MTGDIHSGAVCRETGTHGFEAEAGDVIPASTVTGLPTASAPLPLPAAAEAQRWTATIPWGHTGDIRLDVFCSRRDSSCYNTPERFHAVAS